jgi:hypothetical protein
VAPFEERCNGSTTTLLNFGKHLADPENQRKMFGRQFKDFLISLVSVNARLFHSEPDEHVECICIQGFDWTQHDLYDFHSVISQEKFQHLYRPWRLCYDTRVSSLAGPMESSSSYEISPACVDTMCGSALRITHSGKSTISTIGGLLEVDGKMYAMTASRDTGASHSWHGSRPLSAVSRALHTHRVGHEGAASEPAVVIRDRHKAWPPSTDSAEVEVSWESASLTQADFKKHAGASWRLFRVEPRLHRPNSVPIGLERPTGSSDTAERDRRPPRQRYLSCYSPELRSMRVSLLTGVSERQEGFLLPNPAYIVSSRLGNVEELWTVRLSAERGKAVSIKQ